MAPFLSFAPIGTANAASPEASESSDFARSDFSGFDPQPDALTFLRNNAPDELEDLYRRPAHEPSMGHGRFAAVGNAVRRQVQLRQVSARTADELAGLFREASYTLTEIRQGEAVPALKVERVPADLGSKDGNERKQLFISAILPVVLEVNQRVMADREQLIALRDKLAADPQSMSPIERIWLDDLADRYDTATDQMEELLRRVDAVPPSMAIAQAGVESGWGTSFVARTGNALFGQIQAAGRHSVAVPWKPGNGMPQPFSSIGEATEAYITNLNTHPAYAPFRMARATARERGEGLEGYQLVGTLLRYSERGLHYVQFVRQIMRENELSDFDKARLLEAN